MSDAVPPSGDETTPEAADSSTVVASDTTPEPAPLPAAPPPPEGVETATVTLEHVQANDELSRLIASADRVMDAMGFTEHRRIPQPDNLGCPELLILRRRL